MSRPTPAFVLGALALAAVGCGTPDPAPPARDLLLITIDTARADHFSYAGGAGPGTPRIDALAGAGTAFTNAITPVPLTLPAHASLLTGLQPPSHGIRDNGAFRLGAAATTLAEVLAAAGFRTAAFVGAEVLDARYGLDQGFATYDDEIGGRDSTTFLNYPERDGLRVVEAALDWLDAQDAARTFVWVHLFDPHVPYRPPEPERSRHGSSYAGEIAYTDRVVGTLLDGWERRRGLDRSLVVLTSDHGEALGEHGEATHGVLIHDATLAVPLVLRGPGVARGRAIDVPVHLIDVMPTVLGLLGRDVPPAVQGRDLRPALDGAELRWSERSGYAESLYAQLHQGCAPLFALRERRWKLIEGRAAELFDLRADAGETTDLSRGERERAGRMQAALRELQAELAGGEAEPIELDERRRRVLESLGYAWSSAPARTTACDPRDALRAMSAMADADRLMVSGEVEAAIDAYTALIAAEPGTVDGRVRLAQILIDGGRADEALPVLTAALALAPHEPLLHQKLGRTLERLGRDREALDVYDAGLALHPDARGLRDGRWSCLNRAGRRPELLAETEAAIAADPGDSTARYLRAIACCGQPVAAYIAALERELAELPGDPLLERALAEARREAGARR